METNENIYGQYFSCEHKGGLKESMETEKCITKQLFKSLLKAKIYKFYAYDERIKSKVYILEDMSLNLGFPTWLHLSDKKRVCGFYNTSFIKV